MNGLLKSRKFWLAVFAVIQTVVLHYLSIPQDIWAAIDGLIVTVILSIAIEDAGEKSARQYFIDEENK
jgi:hypothetical protein